MTTDFKTYTATDAKNKFGEVFDSALREPVRIKRNGRRGAVLMSDEFFEDLEDYYLGLHATEVLKKGKSLGVKKTHEYLKSVLGAHYARH